MINEKNIKILRTHDEFYAKEDLNSLPKDSFVQIANLIADYKKNKFTQYYCG